MKITVKPGSWEAFLETMKHIQETYPTQQGQAEGDSDKCIFILKLSKQLSECEIYMQEADTIEAVEKAMVHVKSLESTAIKLDWDDKDSEQTFLSLCKSIYELGNVKTKLYSNEPGYSELLLKLRGCLKMDLEHFVKFMKGAAVPVENKGLWTGTAADADKFCQIYCKGSQALFNKGIEIDKKKKRSGSLLPNNRTEIPPKASSPMSPLWEEFTDMKKKQLSS